MMILMKINGLSIFPVDDDRLGHWPTDLDRNVLSGKNVYDDDVDDKVVHDDNIQYERWKWLVWSNIVRLFQKCASKMENEGEDSKTECGYFYGYRIYMIGYTYFTLYLFFQVSCLPLLPLHTLFTLHAYGKTMPNLPPTLILWDELMMSSSLCWSDHPCSALIRLGEV